MPEAIPLKSFEDIYNRLKFDLARTHPGKIVQRSVDMLNNSYHADISKGPVYVPWIPLALIEWSMVYGPTSNIFLTTEITDQGYNNLYNMLNDGGWSSSEIKFLSSNEPYGLFKFMRCLAHQQFWFQGNHFRILERYAGRNLIVMKEFDQDFIRLTGLSIKKFYEFIFIILARFQTKENGNIIRPIYFDILEKRYGRSQVDLFFSLMSLSFDELQRFLREHYKAYKKNYNAETFLTNMTPLWRFPLLKSGEDYVCIYPALFEYAAKFFIYDYLKQKLGANFSRKLGPIMEGHIEKGLVHLRKPFFNEKEIQNIAQRYLKKKEGQPKCVDFLVKEKNDTLLIESKAQEAPLEVRMNPETEVLEKYFAPNERHLFHGIIQAYEICDFIEKNNIPELAQKNGDFFLILVTYKDFYLGRGKDFWDEFVRNIVTPYLHKKNISEALIKPENIFVLSLDEYDLLISKAKQCKSEITEILKFAIKRDRDPKTQSMIFAAHINAYRSHKKFSLPYVDRVFMNIADELLETIRPTAK